MRIEESLEKDLWMLKIDNLSRYDYFKTNQLIKLL